jgi:nucleoside-diphosphate-sugar epimerase
MFLSRSSTEGSDEEMASSGEGSKVVVTGAAGFIGSFLSERLLQEGYSVIGLDNLFRGKEENIHSLKNRYPQRFNFVRADIARKEEISKGVFEDATAVFHYAAINGTQHFYERPLDVLHVNLNGTLNVIEAATDSRSIEKIVFASSSEVYGEPRLIPTKETEPCVIPDMNNPRHSYSLSKMAGENYLLWAAKQRGIHYLILRIFNTYGPRMDTSSYGQVIPEFIRKLYFDPEFTIIGDGRQLRSFCYVQDNIELTLRAFAKVEDEILNVGNSDEITMLELAALMHTLAEKPFRYRLVQGRAGDILRRSPDISKILSLTGYQPRVPLQEGLRKTVQWYLEKWDSVKVGARQVKVEAIN